MNTRMAGGDTLLQFVTFDLDEQEYGVDILRVQEIIRPTAITRLPEAPESIIGILNLRGKVVPIIDLRLQFGIPETKADGQTRIIVLTGEHAVFGILVDGVSEVLSIEPGMIEETPALSSGGNAQCAYGVGKLEDRMILLLDVYKMTDTELLNTISMNTGENTHV